MRIFDQSRILKWIPNVCPSRSISTICRISESIAAFDDDTKGMNLYRQYVLVRIGFVFEANFYYPSFIFRVGPILVAVKYRALGFNTNDHSA